MCEETNRITDADERYIDATIVGVSNRLEAVERHSIEMHNSRRPLDRLAIYDYRREGKGTATLEQHGC